MKGLLHDEPKKAAKQLARMGEGDDRVLLHVQRDQVPVIAKALGHPGRRNPRTGLLGFDDGEAEGGFGPDAPGTSGGGGPGGMSGAGSANAANGTANSSTSDRDADYGGGWGPDKGGGEETAPTITRTSVTPLTADEVSKTGMKVTDKALGNFTPGPFGAFGFNLGKTPNLDGLLAPGVGQKAANAAVGFSPSALGLGLVDTVTGLPIGAVLQATGVYAPTDYSLVADLGQPPGQTSTVGQSAGGGVDGRNGDLPIGTTTSPTAPTAPTPPQVPRPGYVPYVGDLTRYGFGPGHSFFGPNYGLGAFMPQPATPGQSPTAPTTPTTPGLYPFPTLLPGRY